MSLSNIPTSKGEGLGLPNSLREFVSALVSEIDALFSQCPVSQSEETLDVDDTTQEIDLSAFNSKLVTGHASSVGSLADGSIPGQRKLITLETQENSASDTFALDETNVHNSSGTQATGVTFDAEGEFLLVEWTGSEWQEVYGTATITTA